MEPREFELVRFNPRRLARGAEAAEVRCCHDGADYVLWMSKNDLKKNIAEFGAHPELLKAQEHYRTRKEFPAPDRS